MENTLPNTPKSPRLVGGTWRWFEGDTFQIVFHLSLHNAETKEPITIQPTDEVIVRFASKDSGRIIHVFELTNIVDNAAVCTFTTEISNKFKVGHYVYSIKYCGEHGATTVGANLNAVVEACR